MTAALLLLAAFVLVAACGVFVAAEFAFLAADRPTVERLAAEGDRGAKGTLAALRRLSSQLSGVQIGITLTNLVIGLLAEPALATLLEGPVTSVGLPESAAPGVAVALALIVSTVVTMVLGELVPKNLAISLPVKVAGIVQAPVRMFTRAVAWPILWFNGLANAVLHRFGIEPQEELASARSAEELFAVLRRSAGVGSLERETAILLARSLLFNRRRAQDAMTPRVRMHVIRAEDPVGEVIAQAAETGHSRFPVVGTDIDDVVGLVHVKAALAVPRVDRDEVRIAGVMAQPALVPTSLPFDDLLDALQDRGLQMAVVVDEYGGTAGVITLEDVVEELLGDVNDEFDPAAAVGVRPSKDGWDVPAGLRPDEVSLAIRREVPTGSWTTVAGMFLAQFQSIPTVGDSIVGDGLRWTVRELSGRRIATLHVEPIEDGRQDA